MSEFGYNFREDKDGDYFLYWVLGILFTGALGYYLYQNFGESLYAAKEEKVETVVLGGVLNDSGEYVNAYGDLIGSFFNWKLPNGSTISIPKSGFEESFLSALKENSTGGNFYILDRLYFSSGSSTIDEKSLNQIENLKTILDAYPNLKVLLRGHTDNTGSIETNNALSFQRAQALKTKLIESGVGALRFNTTGKGSVDPIETNETADGRARNRRVDISIIETANE